MQFTVVIPARYASTRLPGKPLLDIAGKSMIQRVYEQATQSQAREVVIATDDERIAVAAGEFGARALMTATTHQSGTDRLEEAATQLGLADTNIVVNVQGDEPLIPPTLIDQVADNLQARQDAAIATLSEPIDAADTFLDPNAVKVVRDREGYALYFSRAPIPWPRDVFAKTRDRLPTGLDCQRHVGIYAYRVSLLKQFVAWPATVLEQAECLEQLRALEHGARIHVEPARETLPGGIDTEQDLARVRALFAGGP